MYKFDPFKTTASAKELFKEERAINHLEGWFIVKETQQKYHEKYAPLPPMKRAAEKFREAVKVLPLSISDNAIFAGTQRDAFARSYALINPSFKVETFAGYCDPTAVYNDIDPTEEFTTERINALRELDKETDYVKNLSKVYAGCEKLTGEVAFFVEQVTGHLIPDMRYALKHGVKAMLSDIEEKQKNANAEQYDNYEAMKIALDCVLILTSRYKAIAEEKLSSATGERKETKQLNFTLSRQVGHEQKSAEEILAEMF